MPSSYGVAVIPVCRGTFPTPDPRFVHKVPYLSRIPLINLIYGYRQFLGSRVKERSEVKIYRA